MGGGKATGVLFDTSALLDHERGGIHLDERVWARRSPEPTTSGSRPSSIPRGTRSRRRLLRDDRSLDAGPCSLP